MLPLHYNDLFDMCPAVAQISHRLHYVPINHINDFLKFINSINRLNDFLPNGIYNHYSDKCPILAHIHRLTFVALPKCHWVVSIHLPDAEVISALPLRYNDSFDICPLHLSTFPSHISVTDFTVSIFLYIIGLFRSTVLRVMSPTRFLCATMMGCHWMVSIHLLWAR